MRRSITSLVLSIALGAALPLGGCVIHGRGAVVVDSEPPPPRYVEVDYRPGYVWIDGYWAYRGATWVWIDGYYERERPGHVHVAGRWVRRSGRWHWVEPRWERGHARDHRRSRPRLDPARRDHRDHRAPRVKQRDHRDDRPKARDHRGDRPDVRDHRDKGPEKRDHRDKGKGKRDRD